MVRKHTTYDERLLEIRKKYSLFSDMYCIEEIRNVSILKKELHALRGIETLSEEELSIVEASLLRATKALSRKREKFRQSDVYKDYIRECQELRDSYGIQAKL